jgi:hypothetical protein
MIPFLYYLPDIAWRTINNVKVKMLS